MLKQINIENAHLLPGLFKERADVNRSYLMELKAKNLLQNFYLEACIRTDRDISSVIGCLPLPCLLPRITTVS